MSLDFALKDFYRKRKQNFPYVITIALTIAISIFLLYFSSALNLNNFIRQDRTYTNPYFFSGAVNIVYTQFNTLLMVLIFILGILMVTIICSSFIISKKRDMSIMKALGTLPEKLYSFYLLEAFIIYILGFFLGWIIGLISFGVFKVIFSIFLFSISFEFELVFSLLLFFSCAIASIMLPGFQLRSIGRKPVINSFSEDIPADYNVSSPLKLVPKWISSFGLNVKYAILNLTRKKGKFKRFFLIFFLISLILFTLGLGAMVLNSSSSNWINKAQGNNIIVIGHNDVVNSYSSMYRMFSDPTVFVDEDAVNFTNSQYLFNFSQIDQISNISGIEKIDQRLIQFSKVKELQTYIISGGGDYISIGHNTEGTFPVIGLNSTNLLQEYEIEGSFFNSQNTADDNITIGDGLAYNFFEYAFSQELQFETGQRSLVSGIVIDPFYSGYSVYIDIEQYRSILNLTNDEINLVLLQIESNAISQLEDQLESNISTYLGPNFTYLCLNEDFNANLSYLNYLSLYSLLLIILTSIISLYSLYHFQKGDLAEQLKDFLIMRSIGSKLLNIGKILFFEAFFILMPAVITSLAGGMIINAVFLFEMVDLPPLYIPFLLNSIILLSFIILNSLILIPILKDIKNSSQEALRMF